MIINDEDNNENANEQIGELIFRESFICQNCHHKLTCQCENTIAFTLLQSNNPLLIQNFNNF